MELIRSVTIGVLASSVVLAPLQPAATAQAPAAGPLHHRILTNVPEAQQRFDFGLLQYYGFNRQAARRAFTAAARLDPKAAMPHIGIALSFGPNLNIDPTAADVAAGCTAAKRGAALARGADERAYADALIERYCSGLSFDAATAYAIGMGTLFQQLPDDPEPATLYAESLLMLNPRSGEQNAELVAVLELVLGRWPTHPGANHYYIHAVEASASPERALASARRLEAMAPIGHLLHMPSHVYTRLGDNRAAVESNESALAADRRHLAEHPGDTEQVMSLEHDLESLVLALGATGQLARIREVITPPFPVAGHTIGRTGHANGQTALRALALLRFARWEEVLALPAAQGGEGPAPAMLRFARAVAAARTNQRELAAAERDAFERQAARIPLGAVYRSNRWRDVAQVHRSIIDARLADARGDTAAALIAWRRAVTTQDGLVYHEPAPVYYPVRESLGAALLRVRQFEEAHKVFATELARSPRSGRSLFGLWQALRALERLDDAERVRRRFQEAWSASDTTLSLDDY
jgi:tetratricopeptide (TPR) repeat protein